MIEYELEFEDGTRNYEARFAASGEDEFLMIVREITERKRQQVELEASRARIVAPGTTSGASSSGTSTTARSSGSSRSPVAAARAGRITAIPAAPRICSRLAR
jgi:hypothetical protein